MKSNTKISKQIERKRNPDVVETIVAAKKNGRWKKIAEVLSSPRKNRICINVEDINEKFENGQVAIIPGKVLSLGDIDKKIKVVALSFSEKAKQKLKNAGCEAVSILKEIKNNPEAKRVKILDENN